MDDFYRCCLWCHWFDKGCCKHDSIFVPDTMGFQCSLEDGIISDAVKEAFSDKAFLGLRRNLESKLSKKKTAEFMQAFFSELETYQRDWTEAIDLSVSEAINAEMQHDYMTVKIADPSTFCCKHFQ